MKRTVAGRDGAVAAEWAARVAPASGLAAGRVLPVTGPLAAFLPAGGVQLGSVVAIEASPGVTGATSLALALAAGPCQAGSWIAGVGWDALGVVAAAEAGVDLERLVLVTRGQDPVRPGTPSRGGPAAAVLAALVDGVDLVVVGPRSRLRASEARRLVARARERGCVLVGVGGSLAAEQPSVRLRVTEAAWEGLGAGWGRLRRRRLVVEATGRGAAARARRGELWLPASPHDPTPVPPPATPVRDPIPLRAVS
ncbi:MAG TPA: hypothetical protein VE575_15735 [Acidimicrobiales bacterium]|nr:hypothetical protein [Acidimicrobiales bacterium]